MSEAGPAPSVDTELDPSVTTEHAGQPIVGTQAERHHTQDALEPPNNPTTQRPNDPKTQSPNHPISKYPNFLITALTISALALRLWGITWSLPNDSHLFSYHPDEGVNLISGVLENGVARPHLDIGFYNYGTVYFYLWQAAVAINSSYGIVKPPPAQVVFPTQGQAHEAVETIGAQILVGRLVSAILGALTVLLVFALGNRLFGYRAGAIAAALFAVMPLAVLHAHFATVDTTATFLVCLSLVFGARLLDGLRWRDVAITGALCGIAAAAKYNCSLVLLAPLAATFLGTDRTLAAKLRSSTILAVCAAAGFLIACPGAYLDWPKFSHDFTYELHKSGEGMGLLFAETPPGWIYHITSSLRYGLGIIPLAAVLAGVVFALVKRTRQDWYLLAFLLVYYAVVGAAQVKFARYMLPLFPALAMLVGRLAAEPFTSVTLRRSASVLAGVAILAAAAMTISFDHVMADKDPRDDTLHALQISLIAPPGYSIGFARLPWYDVPPLAPEFTAPQPALRRQAAEQLTRYKCRLPADNSELDLSIFQPELPDRVILSDLATEDWERLQYKPWLDFKKVLNDSYMVGYQKGNNVWLGGFSLERPDYLPNDILYICPRITVYFRK